MNTPCMGSLWVDLPRGTLREENLAADFYTRQLSGISPHPVYLRIANGRATLCETADIWGQDPFTAERLRIAQNGSAGAATGRVPLSITPAAWIAVPASMPARWPA